MFKKEYTQTTSRAEFGFQKFGEYFGDRIADVGAGGSASFFRQHFGSRYTAIDVSSSRNSPDVFSNFEDKPLPFNDNEFDTVLCFDCLEHCDNIHTLFDELVRISKRYIIISLPNNWPGFITSLIYGHHFTHTAGYGLPGEEPASGVRHKWWFNLEEAENFLRYRAKKNGIHVMTLKHIFEPGDGLLYIPSFYPKIMQVHPQKVRNLLNADPKKVLRHGKAASYFFFLAKKIGVPFIYSGFMVIRYFIGLPLSWFDEILKRCLWGWGGKYRYLNLFCRQIWVVLEKPH